MSFFCFSGSYQRYSEEQTLRIILEDINDQFPIIETTIIEVSESLEQGHVIDTAIIANDKDDPNTDNAKIQFKLIKLQDSEGKDVKQMYEIASQNLSGIAYLSTIKDLENYYGEYRLIIEVSTKSKYNYNAVLFALLAFIEPNFNLPPI